MSQGDLNIKILSPDRILYRGVVKSLGLPGALGYMTLLPGHAAMVAQLDAGVLVYDADGRSERLFMTGGFVDVTDNMATVLADIVEKPTEINVERAKKALDRAQQRLTSPKDSSINVPRALAAKKRATIRLEVAGAAKALH
jgi:F-type H+-transporting ATPase subunit epsilon